MTNPEVAILMLSLFIVLVLLGFPIAFTLAGDGRRFWLLRLLSGRLVSNRSRDVFNNQIFYLLNQNTYSVMENDTLVAIPLFLFMGYVVERANIVKRLYSISLQHGGTQPARLDGDRRPDDLCRVLHRQRHCRRRGDADGAAGLPGHGQCQLQRRSSPAGVICAGGTLGILIPPSIMLIVYAAIAELSPLRLYAAAMFPGLLLAGLYIVYVIIRVKHQPVDRAQAAPDRRCAAGPRSIWSCWCRSCR